jgi:hypothetical protein
MQDKRQGAISIIEPKNCRNWGNSAAPNLPVVATEKSRILLTQDLFANERQNQYDNLTRYVTDFLKIMCENKNCQGK